MVRTVGMRTTKQIQSPPTTHLVAAVDDLTNMLDYDSEDIDGIDDNVGEE